MTLRLRGLGGSLEEAANLLLCPLRVAPPIATLGKAERIGWRDISIVTDSPPETGGVPRRGEGVDEMITMTNTDSSNDNNDEDYPPPPSHCSSSPCLKGTMAGAVFLL